MERNRVAEVAAESLDVLIVAYRRADQLDAALRSVDAQLPEARTFVWDNLSAGSAAIRELSRRHPDVRWTFHRANIGFAAAVNRLVEQSSSPYFLLLNPDAELLSPLHATRATVQGTRVAAAAPWEDDGTTRPPWDNAHRAPTLIRQLVSYAGFDNRLARCGPASMLYARQPGNVSGYLTGSCLMVSRDAWTDVGPFDERYFVYGEEADWCARARERGWRIVSVPEPGIAHRAGGSVADHAAARAQSAELLREGQVRYLRDHRGAVAAVSYERMTRLMDAVQPSKRRLAARRTGRRYDYIITSNTLAFGGAERQRVALANELTARGAHVQMRLLQGEGDLRTELDAGVDVRVADWRTSFTPGDLLVTGTTNTELAHGFLWRAQRPRRRWIVANHHYAHPKEPVFTPAQGWLMRRADGMVYLSESHRRDHLAVQRLDTGRYWVVPNGVRCAAEQVARASGIGPVSLVFVGRLLASKQADLAVQALSDGMDDLQWTFDIFGDGPERSRIEASIPAHLVSRIRTRGWCRDVARQLRDADVFVFPSRLEALPMVILEAMCAGVPVVAGPVASVPEMLADGAGVLVPSWDPDQWRSALRGLISDPDQRRRVGAAGRHRQQLIYSTDAMVAGYQRIHEELTSG